MQDNKTSQLSALFQNGVKVAKMSGWGLSNFFSVSIMSSSWKLSFWTGFPNAATFTCVHDLARQNQAYLSFSHWNQWALHILNFHRLLLASSKSFLPGLPFSLCLPWQPSGSVLASPMEEKISTFQKNCVSLLIYTFWMNTIHYITYVYLLDYKKAWKPQPRSQKVLPAKQICIQFWTWDPAW